MLICTHCHSFVCTCSLGAIYQDQHDELIVFDFGSKTTWFKYTGGAGIGQLSMHPTIQPLNCSLALSDDLCLVCTKTSYQHPQPIRRAETVSPRKSSTKTFSRRSLCNLDCFGSSSSGKDDAEFVKLSAINSYMNTSSISEQTSVSETCDVRLFEFLMSHIIRRNPCFQICNIPFVICQPATADDSMKRKLIHLLMCQLKVPE